MNDDPKDTTAPAGGLGDAAATATDTTAEPMAPTAGTVMPPAAPGDGGASPMGGAPVTPGLPDTTAPGAEAPAAEGGLPVTAPRADTPASPSLAATPTPAGTTEDGK